MSRPMLLLVAFLFLGFLAMQWMAFQNSARKPEVWGVSKRRYQRLARKATPEERKRLLEAADGGPPPKTPPVLIASLVMTLIAIGVLLWL
jgi:hypothetical protein